jgi:ABC-type Na+ efflux pump permease subunit
MVMVIGIGVLIGLITAIVLIALGLLAAYASIIARRANAPSYFEPVLYQGWLSCVCGIWVLFNGGLLLTTLRHGLSVFALFGPLEVVFGLLFAYLGYALLAKRAEQVRQIRLGYVAVVFGVLAIYPTLSLRFLFVPGPVQVSPVQVR